MNTKNKAFIYAGHHNNDSGAIGFDGVREADVTKVFRNLVATGINKIDKDISVIVDNDNDSLSVVISKTRGIIQSNDLLVEYHVNSSSNESARGTEVFISDNARIGSKKLAYDLNYVMPRILNTADRGVKTESQSNRGKLGILSMRGRAVLVELYFGSNEIDTVSFRKNMHWLAYDHALIIVHHINNPDTSLFLDTPDYQF